MPGRRSIFAAALALSAALLLVPGAALACNGADVILAADPAARAAKSVPADDGKVFYLDEGGKLLMDESEAAVSPGLALSIAERFIRRNVPGLSPALAFRKLEYVHGKLIYQFQSERVPGYKGDYHLGPVNFSVDRLVLDVDAHTGDLYLANGCGAAPGQKLYAYRPSDFPGGGPEDYAPVPNNTGFMARRTENRVTVDGVIEPGEWKDAAHRYFYIGEYSPHPGGKPHEKPFYHVEVRAQITGDDLYFAVKTYSPYWVSILMKGDPNLGMLGAYRDAKLLRSDGSITDRHFIQRKDKTFFLAPDERDDILSSASRQSDAYTYEFAMPLDSGDPEDVALREGRAYNILVLVGNTLKHYGIFTLDDAHKNHDHSKNNPEHVDVWASNETTLRIGDTGMRDIYGRPAGPAPASLVTGFDPARNGTHLHYAASVLGRFGARGAAARVAGLLSLALGLGGLGVMAVRLRRRAPAPPEDPAGADLMRIGPVRRFLMWRHFRLVFIVPTLLVFALIVYLGFFDVQDGRRNIATVYTWSLWWSLIIFSFIVAGRAWCMMCPFAALGDLAQKVVCLNRKLPRRLQNMGFQALAFVALTWAFTTFAFDASPLVTAGVIAGILAAAVGASIIYRRRSFCRHLCPIGAVIGIYSMVSPVELRSEDKGRCSAHRAKTCSQACPMLESPQEMESNVYCNFCMKCRPACPGGNLSLRLRPPGKDIYAGAGRTFSEALASLLLLGIIAVETLAMTSVWQPLKDGVSAATGLGSPLAVYTILFLAFTALPGAVFFVLCRALASRDGTGPGTLELVRRFAFVFVPLGVGLHLAHNLQHLIMEGGLAVPATLRLLDNAGLATAALNWNPAPPLGAGTLFSVQMATLLGALWLTMTVLYRLLRRFDWSPKKMLRTAVAMSLYAVAVALVSVYLLGLPMSARHIH